MSALFYRLNGVYALRGWQGMTAALVRRPWCEVQPLTQEQFRVLLLCDGETELGGSLLSDAERGILDSFVEEKVVSPSTVPAPIRRGQQYHRYQNRYVRTIQWSITGQCNYRCRHCYMDAPDAAMGELSHEEAMDIIDQIAQCGVFRVDLTGGEPLVRSDFWELVDAIRAKGIVVGQIYTNGWLVDEALLTKFEERRMRPEFSVSFDGIGWHDWMRGVKGAEEAALRCLCLCAAHDFPTNVEMCVHKGNIHTLRETVNLLAGIGVSHMKCAGVADTELWRRNSEGYGCDWRGVFEAFVDYIPQFYEDGCPMRVTLGGVAVLEKGFGRLQIIPEHFNGTESAKQCHLCGAVRMNAYITAEGRLLPCISMTSCKEQEQFPKIADIGLQKGLSDSSYMKFIDSRVSDIMAVNQKCRECPYVLRCGGGCRASGLMATGDFMGVDEELCVMWREGYVDRIRQVAEDAIRRFPPKETKDEPTAG